MKLIKKKLTVMLKRKNKIILSPFQISLEMSRSLPFILILLLILSCGDSGIEDPKNGDLNKGFKTGDLQNEIEKEQKELEKLKILGYNKTYLSKGEMPNCYNFKPIYSNIDNYLNVNVGGNTDVAIKVMNASSNQCIRFVYVNSNSSFKIKNIPEGIFYLKIAYGKDWYMKNENGKCIGQFTKNPIYEKGQDLMDFNIQRTVNGKSIPYYDLELDIVASDYSNTFDTQNISEDDFNN